MPRFLIEVSHDARPLECLMAIQILQKTGSHFVTHADFGCLDGIHKSWVTVEVESKDEARNMLPPAYRSKATIVKLNKFTVEEIDELIKHHQSAR
jgi:hypothetical protein